MSNKTDMTPNMAPTYLISDYIEIAYLGVVILLGIPGNLIVLNRLLIEQKVSTKDVVKSGFVMLKIHLNITDHLILIYALGKFAWLITYQWVGGDFLCRVYQLFSMFSLYSSSNIVVCIALDRLRNVLCANKIHSKSRKINTVAVMAITSWVFSFVCSVPQFFLFQTIVVAEYNNFVQCTDVWQINRFSKGAVGFDENSIILNPVFEDAYNVIHLILVFWGPLVVLIVTYVIIATRLTKYSLKSPTRISRPLPTEEPIKETLVLSDNDRLLRDRSHYQLYQSEQQSRNNLVAYTDCNSQRGSRIYTPIKAPTWRRQLRSRVFRTTILVILVHFLFWFPYNALGFMKYVNQPLFEELSANANIFKDLQILITLINPFMYGFKISK